MQGECCLCLQIGELTDEHVPPQLCGNKGLVRRHYPHKQMTGAPAVLKKSRNGYYIPKCVCRTCNGEKLSAYDVELGRFSHDVKSRIDLLGKLPPSLKCSYEFKINPQAIARAIIGHSIASDETRHKDVRLCDLRKYFLNQQTSAGKYNVFCWVYPYEQFEISNDIITPSVRGVFNSTMRVRTLNFFPLAFMVAECEEYPHTARLNLHSNFQKIEVNLHADIHPDYPNDVAKDSFILLGEAGMNSIIIRSS